VEQASYEVTKRSDGYEVRKYPAHLVAQTIVRGSYRAALNEGFRIVAGYIFGGNVKQQNIAMTAPVTERRVESEKVAMTAPVLATMEGESHVISFGMPRDKSKATLPTPIDDRVQIVEIPEKVFAVRRFSWSRSDMRVEAMKKKLLADVSRDKLRVTGNPVYAGYNAPWTPPWLTRHEVMVEIAR
jgi:hypothetical protein